MGDDVDEARRSRSLPVAILAYAIALAAFLLVPPILHASVGPPVGFTLQEGVDLFTPIVVLPLAWWVLECLGGLGRRELLVFLVIAIVWVEGQAIHLATNAIGDVFTAGPARDAFYATQAGDLDHWFDEGLGHWLWHLAWAALSVLMLFVASRRSASPAASVAGMGALAVAAVAGVIQGVTFFFVTVEGETTLLGVPFSVAVVAWTVRETARGSTNPAIRFFLVSAAVTLLAYIGWIALEGWPFAEPCAVIGC
jgi:hypothetical protein